MPVVKNIMKKTLSESKWHKFNILFTYII